MRETNERRCLDCNKLLPPGRSDKVYCDDICRARATRARNRLDALTGYENAHRAVIAAINRNYRLLKKAIGGREEWMVDFSELYVKGFDQKFYTSSVPLENGRTRYYCFEIGWEERESASFWVTVDPSRLVVVSGADQGFIL